MMGIYATASRHWQTPQENRATLVEPPIEHMSVALEANRQLRRSRHYDLQGRAFEEVALLARRELIESARQWTGAYRDIAAMPGDREPCVFLAGHQPQIVHPGVWLKNFVLSRLAGRHGGVAVNLIIDSDICAAVSLRTPIGPVASPRTEAVAFDSSRPIVPFEERPIADREAFGSFGRRVAEQMALLTPSPLIADYWPMVQSRSLETDNLGACLAQARHQLEGQWGLQTLEVPQSRVCSGEAFRWFVAHILAQLPRFHGIYNEAIRQYRRLHRLRSTAHPAPDLAEDGPWLESPFWIWTAENPLRRRLFARRDRKETVLSDRQTWETTLPLYDDGDAAAAVAKLCELQRNGIKIRSRALLTTLWARLALGDWFIHGIGGAKYDEVTDCLIERFFGFAPPSFMVVSGTLHLPLPRQSTEGDNLAAIDHMLRDMTYHPERFLNGDTAVPQELIASKQRWIQTPQTPENAKQRCHAIRRANEAMQAGLAERRRRLVDRRTETAHRLAADRVLTWREYGFCLYPETSLREFLNQ